MRVLLDACVDPRMVEAFVGNEVRTAFDLGWYRLKDHELLSLIQGQFDVFVTIDQGFEFQHNLKRLSFGIVIVHIPINKVELYRPLFPELIAAVERVEPGKVIHVGMPPVKP
jgi:hypothetical protein